MKRDSIKILTLTLVLTGTFMCGVQYGKSQEVNTKNLLERVPKGQRFTRKDPHELSENLRGALRVAKTIQLEKYTIRVRNSTGFGVVNTYYGDTTVFNAKGEIIYYQTEREDDIFYGSDKEEISTVLLKATMVALK